MTTQTEALKLALEALCTCGPQQKQAIAAIKEALAQQCVCGEPDSAGTHRTDGPCLAPQPEQCTYPNCDYPCMNLPDCKEPKQEQHKQYPVNSLPNEKTTDKWESARVSDYNSGWNDCRKTMFISNTKPVLEIVNGQINRSWDAIPENFTGLLYTTPPQRKPLTDAEFAYVWREETGRIMGTDKTLLLRAKQITEAAHGIKE